MTATVVVTAILVASAAMCALEFKRRKKERENQADYMRRIQILKAEKPMLLPPVKPLQAQRTLTRIERFRARMGL